MFLLYSTLMTLGFFILLPRFLFDSLRKGKYSASLWQRLGNIPAFLNTGFPVLWVHCVSVGETNAAFPIVKEILKTYPNYRLVVSTTTRTGQELAQKLFKEFAELVFYFPFDWKFSVRRALRIIKPNIVLLMEGEIWFNFVREASKRGTHIFVVNGRLSEKSFNRFTYIKKFMARVLNYVTLALMQDKADANRIKRLGIRANKVRLTGNVKFDQQLKGFDVALTDELRSRFNVSPNCPLIVAASTHEPEEELILEAFEKVSARVGEISPRLLLAPRHPDRFGKVADLIKKSGFEFARRSEQPAVNDQKAQIILLDSIGELRSVLPLAQIVFVGGSLIPHGGQNILEAAAVEKAIITGYYTANFDAILKQFLKHDAIIQLPELDTKDVSDKLAEIISKLLHDPLERAKLAQRAFALMLRNRGATQRTVEYLNPFLTVHSGASHRFLD